MKSLLALTITAGLMIGSAQAGPLPVLGVDCGIKIATADQSTINSYNGAPGGKFAAWAVDEIIAAGLEAPDLSSFSKMDTSDQMVMIGAGDQFIITHFGAGGNPEPYQIIDVSDCAPGEHWLPSPRPSGGGLSWVGRIGGDGRVPDGGTTVLMLGLALCGLASSKKLLKR